MKTHIWSILLRDNVQYPFDSLQSEVEETQTFIPAKLPAVLHHYRDELW